jgi:hypothetical protein
LIALIMLAPLARAAADEDEDDPKGAPNRPAAVAPRKPRAQSADAAARPKDAVARPEPKTAEPGDAPVKRAVDARATKPAAAATGPAATPQPKAAPATPAATAPAPAPRPRAAAVDTDAPMPPTPRKLTARPPAESVAAKVATTSATLDPAAPLPNARTVRVRLADGSSVVGLVHAEEPDALVVDCSLGQLAIPRSRISTIAYDAAAGAGSKHAPVQQLDDDAPPPRKRPAAAQP